MTARKKNPQGAGRKTIMTKDVLQKLEDAFAFTYTDEEACLYAGISPQTLYNYQKRVPKFVERKEALRLKPNLMAKQVLVEGISKNLDQSRWWATHKMPEFTPKQKVEHSGIIEGGMDQMEMSPKMQEAARLFREAKREQIIEDIKAKAKAEKEPKV